MALSAAYAFNQVPAAAVAYWSFKLHKDKFSATLSDTENMSYGSNEFLRHSNGGIFGAGVCQLGKVGAWAILATLIITFMILVAGEKRYKKENSAETSKHSKKHVLAVIIINSIVFGIVFILSTLLNPHLLIRTLPFYSLQTAVLCNLGYVYSITK